MGEQENRPPWFSPSESSGQHCLLVFLNPTYVFPWTPISQAIHLSPLGSLRSQKGKSEKMTLSIVSFDVPVFIINSVGRLLETNHTRVCAWIEWSRFSNNPQAYHQFVSFFPNQWIKSWVSRFQKNKTITVLMRKGSRNWTAKDDST